MNMKLYYDRLLKHPLGALYGTLLGIVAFLAARPMYRSGMWEAALVDLAMAVILIGRMLKIFVSTDRKYSGAAEKWGAWGMVLLANVLALLPAHDFPGCLSTAFAFSLLICAFVLYFSGRYMAFVCIAPALWCCVFIPYHEEFMLLLSFPLRLSATMLSAWMLKLCGIGVVYSGTSLTLPGLNLAITDACSGIYQLDAFILIAFIAVQMMHRRPGWQVFHFAFIIPAVMVGNSLRIVLTVLLCKFLGDYVLLGAWHVALGYAQILFALLIFLGVGWLFSAAAMRETAEAEK